MEEAADSCARVLCDTCLLVNFGRIARLDLLVEQHRDWLIASDEGRRTRRRIVEQIGAARLLTTLAIVVRCIRAGALNVAAAAAIEAVRSG